MDRLDEVVLVIGRLEARLARLEIRINGALANGQIRSDQLRKELDGLHQRLELYDQRTREAWSLALGAHAVHSA